MEEEIPTEKSASRKYTRVFIDNLVSFASDCKHALYNAMYEDLDVSKMVSLILNEFDKSTGYVQCHEDQ